MRGMLLLSALLTACTTGTAPGSAWSDDALVARVIDNPTQTMQSGTLVTLDTAFEPCSEPTIGGGPVDFAFTGAEAVADVSVPEAELCGIRIVVDRFIIEATDDGVAKTVVGQDFDLWFASSEALPAGEPVQLGLGDEDWLADFLPLAAEGTTVLNDEADPALLDAFYDGLTRGSSFVLEDRATYDE